LIAEPEKAVIDTLYFYLVEPNLEILLLAANEAFAAGSGTSRASFEDSAIREVCDFLCYITTPTLSICSNSSLFSI